MAARDYEHFSYWTIAIKKGSPTHNAILDDAEDHTSLKQIPTLLSLRIEEFYALRDAGLLFTGPGKQQEVTTKAGTIQHESDIHLVEINEAQAAANADEADNLFD
jgi:hypothetical protein